MRTTQKVCLLLAILLLTSALPVLASDCHSEPAADDPHADHAVVTSDTEPLGSMHIPDVELVDQDGRPVNFYSDLVRDRVVAMNFIFTTCTTICPPMGANFSKLQKLIDEDGREIELISVSVDPVVDTPQRLAAWGKKFGRRHGWTLVTGSKTEVDRLLKSLQVFTPDKTDHSPIVLLGDAASNRWTRTYGLTAPAQLAEMVGELATNPATTDIQEGR